MQNHRSKCCDVRPYYYDILCEESHDDVPDAALLHVSECYYCQSEIERLGAALNEADDSANAQSRRDAKLLQLLRLHFSYTNKTVTCCTVKPFLPSMTDELVRIRIPTPITAHLEQCTRCASDLSALRGLELSQAPSDRFALGKHVEHAGADDPDVALLPTDSDMSDADESGAGHGKPIPLNINGEDSEQDAQVHSTARDWPIVKTGLRLFSRHVGKIAAVLAISFVLLALTNVSPVEAGPGSPWHEALLSTHYFHISSTAGAGHDRPDREMWVLRDERVFVERDVKKDSISLLDLPGGQRRSIKLSTGKLDVEPIAPHRLRALEQEFKTLAGIVSFGRLDGIPATAEHKVEGRVHEYEWPSSGLGDASRTRCVVSLAADQDFPETVQVSVMEAGKDRFEPTETIRIGRLSKEDAGDEVDEFYPRQ